VIAGYGSYKFGGIMSETRTPCIADNNPNQSRVAVILPVRNAGDFAKRQVDAFNGQIPVPHVMVIDSESTDGSPDIYRAGGFEVIPIAHKDFDHGATRNFAMTLCDADIIVFMTHDSILQRPDSIIRLCAPFADPAVGVVYGRQLPRPQARAIERHARYFNYPAISSVRTWPSARRLGIRAAFNSNTFCACRRVTLDQIGGFPHRCLIGEDQIVAAHALLAGWSVVYASDAIVEHSHGYTMAQEFQRYFENGVNHGQYKTLFDSFMSPSGEGRRYVLSELRYLLRHAPHRIPEAGLRTVLKLTAYHLGRHESLLPVTMKRKFTMYPLFFDQQPSKFPNS
jgi:rhamnosyltransferase